MIAAILVSLELISQADRSRCCPKRASKGKKTTGSGAPVMFKARRHARNLLRASALHSLLSMSSVRSVW
jgi:hypothetical protein